MLIRSLAATAALLATGAHLSAQPAAPRLPPPGEIVLAQSNTMRPLTGSGCPAAGTRSPSSSRAGRTTFVNGGSGGLISIYWVDFNGNWVHYADLPRGDRYTADSYVRHVWVVVGERRNCLGTSVVSDGAPTFTY